MATSFVANLATMTWIWSGGTVVLDGDYRKYDITPSAKAAIATAGHDTREQRYPTIADAKVAVQLVARTGGTAMLAAFLSNTLGTLICGPEGTVAGKPKTTLSAICQGMVQHYAYATESLLDVAFDGDGVSYAQGNY